MQQQKTFEEFVERIEVYKEYPELFFEEVLGINLPIHQKSLLKDIHKYNEVTVKSANSIGKTYVIAATSVWYFFTHLSADTDSDVVVVFTAPTFSQIKRGIFAKIKDFIKRANKNISYKYGNEFKFITKDVSENRNNAEYWFDDTSYMMGIATEAANNVSGIHAKHLLIIMDEAQGIKDDIFSGFEGVLQSGNYKLVLLGNTTLPNGATGKFYNSFDEKSPFHKITVSAFDTPNFLEPNIEMEDFLRKEDDPLNWRNKLDRYTGLNYQKYKAKDEVSRWENESRDRLPNPTLVNPISAFKTLMKAGMNVDDYEFLTRIRAEFPTQSAANLFQFHDIETSMRNYIDDTHWDKGDFRIGLDVAQGLGKDDSYICVTNGNKVIELEGYNLDAPQLVEKAVEYYRKYKVPIKLERDGVGKTICDYLKKEEVPFIPIVMGGSPGIESPFDEVEIEETKIKKETFYRKRDECWWHLREILSKNRYDGQKPILLPPDEELRTQLRAITYRKMPNGRTQVIGKDDLRKILGKSPDKLDSIVIAYAPTETFDPLSLYGFDFIQTPNNPSWRL